MLFYSSLANILELDLIQDPGHPPNSLHLEIPKSKNLNYLQFSQYQEINHQNLSDHPYQILTFDHPLFDDYLKFSKLLA